MATYRKSRTKPISKICPEQRMSNQVTLSGTNQTFPVDNGYFFLELLILESEKAVEIKDGNGNSITGGATITGFENDYVPLVCEDGIEFVGDVLFAKGFVLTNIGTIS